MLTEQRLSEQIVKYREITVVRGLGCRIIYANVLYLLVVQPIVIFGNQEAGKLVNLGDAMLGFVSDIYDILFLFVIASEFVSFSCLTDIQSFCRPFKFFKVYLAVCNSLEYLFNYCPIN